MQISFPNTSDEVACLLVRVQCSEIQILDSFNLDNPKHYTIFLSFSLFFNLENSLCKVTLFIQCCVNPFYLMYGLLISSNTGITWELVKNAESWPLPQTTESDFNLTRFPSFLHAMLDAFFLIGKMQVVDDEVEKEGK